MNKWRITLRKRNTDGVVSHKSYVTPGILHTFTHTNLGVVPRTTYTNPG